MCRRTLLVFRSTFLLLLISLGNCQTHYPSSAPAANGVDDFWIIEGSGVDSLKFSHISALGTSDFAPATYNSLGSGPSFIIDGSSDNDFYIFQNLPNVDGLTITVSGGGGSDRANLSESASNWLSNSAVYIIFSTSMTKVELFATQSAHTITSTTSAIEFTDKTFPSVRATAAVSTLTIHTGAATDTYNFTTASSNWQSFVFDTGTGGDYIAFGISATVSIFSDGATIDLNTVFSGKSATITAGADGVDVRLGAATNRMDAIQGTVQIHGTSSTSRVRVFDAASTRLHRAVNGTAIAVTASELRGYAPAVINWDEGALKELHLSVPDVVTPDGFPTAEVTVTDVDFALVTNSSGDSVTMWEITRLAGALSMYQHTMGDEIVIHELHTLKAPVEISTGMGASLVLSDAANPLLSSGDLYTATLMPGRTARELLITGIGNASAIDNITVSMGSGSTMEIELCTNAGVFSSVVINATISTTTIHGGASDDEYVIYHTDHILTLRDPSGDDYFAFRFPANTLGDVIVSAGRGEDFIDIDASGNTAGLSSVELKLNGIANVLGTGLYGIRCTEAEVISLEMTSYDDGVRVSSPPLFEFALHLAAGNDDVDITLIGSVVTVEAGPGNDTVVLTTSECDMEVYGGSGDDHMVVYAHDGPRLWLTADAGSDIIDIYQVNVVPDEPMYVYAGEGDDTISFLMPRSVQNTANSVVVNGGGGRDTFRFTEPNTNTVADCTVLDNALHNCMGVTDTDVEVTLLSIEAIAVMAVAAAPPGNQFIINQTDSTLEVDVMLAAGNSVKFLQAPAQYVVSIPGSTATFTAGDAATSSFTVTGEQATLIFEDFDLLKGAYSVSDIVLGETTVRWSNLVSSSLVINVDGTNHVLVSGSDTLLWDSYLHKLVLDVSQVPVAATISAIDTMDIDQLEVHGTAHDDWIDFSTGAYATLSIAGNDGDDTIILAGGSRTTADGGNGHDTIQLVGYNNPNEDPIDLRGGSGSDLFVIGKATTGLDGFIGQTSVVLVSTDGGAGADIISVLDDASTNPTADFALNDRKLSTSQFSFQFTDIEDFEGKLKTTSFITIESLVTQVDYVVYVGTGQYSIAAGVDQSTLTVNEP